MAVDRSRLPALGPEPIFRFPEIRRGALASGISPLTGALVGAAVGGLAGAIWADANNDGCVDGYVREGQYYSGAPVVQPIPTTYTGERG